MVNKNRRTAGSSVHETCPNAKRCANIMDWAGREKAGHETSFNKKETSSFRQQHPNYSYF